MVNEKLPLLLFIFFAGPTFADWNSQQPALKDFAWVREIVDFEKRAQPIKGTLVNFESNEWNSHISCQHLMKRVYRMKLWDEYMRQVVSFSGELPVGEQKIQDFAVFKEFKKHSYITLNYDLFKKVGDIKARFNVANLPFSIDKFKQGYKILRKEGYIEGTYQKNEFLFSSVTKMEYFGSFIEVTTPVTIFDICIQKEFAIYWYPDLSTTTGPEHSYRFYYSLGELEWQLNQPTGVVNSRRRN